MAEVEEDSKGNHSPLVRPSQQSLSFVEVICKSSGKIRRFAFETEAGFAVNLINKKLEGEEGLGIPLASHIEAVKEGEIPVSFGPNSVLVDYGPGWNLQTVYDTGIPKAANVIRRRVHKEDKVMDDSNLLQKKSQPANATLYIGKILVAFVLIFMFGAMFTLFLENLPLLILYINSLV
ncbi:hypothetical protein ACH5RR_021190 [Cinchona calisaya]|uniref:Uncharacterized protein n=1 Tax=Cinchona calisaya TaxID=153742 RepID=A0ABD2ZGK1_9GENT